MPVPDASAPRRAERLLGGRYRLEQMLAQGGMAAVWVGHDEILARAVAVKILHAHLAADQSFLERFRHEAVAAARLSHPNVVATYDAGMTDDGTAFIVMELVRGRTLRQYLAEHGPLPPWLASAIALQMADALAHAHAAGLVHRDIKPGNVLIDDSDVTSLPRVKVTDFGIAKAAEGLGADLTRTGVVLGTPKYLSPEQIEGIEPDARADLYALGVVLFELLTGQPPFVGRTDMATAVQHLNAVPPRARTLQPGVPVVLDDLVFALMAKRPDARPPTALAVRQLLVGLQETAGATGATGAIFGPVGSPGPPTGTNGAAVSTGSVGSVGSFGEADATGAMAASPWSLGAPATGAWGSPSRPLPPVPPPRPGADRTPTPPTAIRPARRRPNWPGRVVALLVVVGVVVAVVAFTTPGGKGAKTSPPPTATTVPLSPLAISSVSVFHLERDADNAALTHNAFDGDPNTSWTTDRYFGPGFAGLRHGLGLAIVLGASHKLHQLVVTSPTQGWSAEVYVASAVPNPPSLAGWGKPVDTKQGINGNATFNLGGTDGSTVLLWLTDLGPTYQAAIAELQVS